MKYSIYVIIITIGLILVSFTYKRINNNIPKDGYIPNKEIALQIGIILLKNQYGDKIFQNPIDAELVNNQIWEIYWVLPENVVGGGPYLELNKRDCKVIRMEFQK